MTAPLDDELSQFKANIPEQSPLSIVVFDTDLRILWVNDSMAVFCDIPAERWVGRRLSQMLQGSEICNVELMLRHVLETGERITDVEHPGPMLFGSRATQVWGCSGFQIKEADGGVIGVAMIARDATRRSHERQRLALLNEASAAIGSTLDLERTAEETLDMLVPRVGDSAHINLMSYVL
jgi:PAS domain-containing protein